MRQGQIYYIAKQRPLQNSQANCTKPRIAETKHSPVHSFCRCLTPQLSGRPEYENDCEIAQIAPRSTAAPVQCVVRQCTTLISFKSSGSFLSDPLPNRT